MNRLALLHSTSGWLFLAAELGGRTIFEVERAEVGIELASDACLLMPAMVSSRGK